MNVSNSIGWLFSDIWQMTKRNLRRYIRTPQLLIFSTIQPIMFTLLFTLVFGGAVSGSSGEYIQFLIPGIMAQTILFGATNTGVGLAEDLKKGIIDRFRSLPMSRSAVLAGRILADSIRNFWVTLIIIAVGYLLGFRIQTSIGEAILGILVIVLVGFVLMWIMATVGLMTKDAETTQAASFVIIFPLTFASSAFVPTETMDNWFRVITENNPVTHAINTTRGLLVTGDYTASFWYLLIWIVVILAIFIPLAINQYRKT